ncbi:MAG: biosynthetic arginine decarboxylase [Planctomycetaceae bacterium]|jgi:arginine decarboxylase|nr:biosynthetic arginine decarboxylase [Phycisphaerales bacterium]MCE2652641.1 biosynthetic arginine decarboxylase [Planctomycetaceae bacterium]
MATISTQKNAFLHGRWTAEESARLYGIVDWGKGYIGVNPAGHITVMPTKDPARQVDLHEIITGLRERGIHTPVLLRFNDLLDHRLREIRKAFDDAMAEQQYNGGYCCVYPIKVNQQRHVCEQIANLAVQLNFGLEAGSKPELLAVLGLSAVAGGPGVNGMPIICNGFKDSEFIETVILATKLGRNIIPVVEKFSELELIVKHAKAYNVKPKIGLRVKLSSRGAGRWESSAGARSKFGLFVSEVLKAVDYLRSQNMLDCLNLLHCHVGSQLYDIRVLKNAVNELTHIYTELHRLGAGLTMLDIGGGMGVDYDGSQSAWSSSINYSVAEYAADVVYRIKTVCEDAGVPHPMILTESGRAMVAYSSILVMDVLGTSRFEADPGMDAITADMKKETEVPQPVLDLIDAHTNLTDRNLVETYHDATQARDEAMQLFSLGYMSLPMRAAAERLFWAIGHKLLERALKKGELPEEFESLPESLSDIYFCNFSLFQSMPDSWAIDQLFPIAPIHRLTEEPTRRGILSDVTCDSDGKIDHFVDKRIDKKSLELHEVRALTGDEIGVEPYYLGVFLLGAYQEILGDLHNLLGDTHAVHISVDPSGGWDIEEVIEGDTVEEVLSYVQYDIADMKRAMRLDIEAACKQGRLTFAEGKSLLQYYDNGLEGYTYLEE